MIGAGDVQGTAIDRLSDTIVDSSVVAKWILPEADSAQAQRLVTEVAAAGERLVALDVTFPEIVLLRDWS